MSDDDESRHDSPLKKSKGKGVGKKSKKSSEEKSGEEKKEDKLETCMLELVKAQVGNKKQVGPILYV